MIGSDFVDDEEGNDEDSDANGRVENCVDDIAELHVHHLPPV
jgi:hypothetical protein